MNNKEQAQQAAEAAHPLLTQDEFNDNVLLVSAYEGDYLVYRADVIARQAAFKQGAQWQSSQTPAVFQDRVKEWLLECFGEEIAKDKVERNHRFLEESLELVQSLGCTISEAHQLVDYVFNRPIGEPTQEVGGVIVTLAALCSASDLNMQECGEIELARIWVKIDKIREKQAGKPKHSPLPENTPAALPVVSGGEKMLMRIKKENITKELCNQGELFYKVDATNIRWCAGYDDFLVKQKKYTDWYLDTIPSQLPSPVMPVRSAEEVLIPISVNNELPEENILGMGDKPYIARMENEFGAVFYKEVSFDGSTWFVNNDYGSFNYGKVTHWYKLSQGTTPAVVVEEEKKDI